MLSIQNISLSSQTTDVDMFDLLEDILLAHSFIPLHNLSQTQLQIVIPYILQNYRIPVEINDGSKLVKQLNKFSRLITVGKLKFTSSGHDAIKIVGTQVLSFIECLANFVDLFDKGKTQLFLLKF